MASQVTGETEIDTGLVIYEGTTPVTGDSVGEPGTLAWTASCERNQWVWVPVEDVNRIYDKDTGMSKLYKITSTGSELIANNNREPGILTNYDNELYFSKNNTETFLNAPGNNLPGMTRENLLYEIEYELKETIKSIEKYGGFYIGRYETGSARIYNTVPVVQRMQGDYSIDYAFWYNSYKKLRTLGVNENIKVNMIYGCLWDETLQWFRDSGAKTSEELFISTSWGNHTNSEDFTFYTNIEGTTTNDKIQGNYIRTPTGATERNKANNIYDMAGNLMEWTIEGDGTENRILRGGNYLSSGNGFNVGYRTLKKINEDSNGSALGVRAYLYIK